MREDVTGLEQADQKTGQRRRTIFLWAVFTFELIASLAAQLPTVYSFSTFVFYDPGSFLCVDWLVAQRFIPTIDFGYPYGLLSLIFGRAAFELIGRTPATYLAATLLLDSVAALGLARLAARWHWAVVVLLAVAIPHALHPSYLALTHPLEAALLTHAIADLSVGKRSRALALTTACVFVKPSMAYVLGLALVILLLASLWRERPRSIADLVAPFVPAVLTGLACAAVSALYFGWLPLVNSVLPLDGIKSYVALDFGFFGNGRTFWWPDADRFSDFVRHYVTTPAGFWLLGSLLLGIWGLVALAPSRRSINAAQREALVVVAACHFSFIFMMFGWPGSWTYYSYLLVAGVCIGLQFSWQRWRAVAAPLLLLALTGLAQTYQASVNNWRYSERTPVTAGLWADAQQRDEWSRVIELAHHRPLLFLHNGCASILFPEVQVPQAYFLSPAMQTPQEIANLRRQIEQASVVVSFNHAAVLDAWSWPEFADQRAQFETTWSGLYLTIHERRRPVLTPVRKVGRPTSYQSTK